MMCALYLYYMRIGRHPYTQLHEPLRPPYHMCIAWWQAWRCKALWCILIYFCYYLICVSCLYICKGVADVSRLSYAYGYGAWRGQHWRGTWVGGYVYSIKCTFVCVHSCLHNNSNTYTTRIVTCLTICLILSYSYTLIYMYTAGSPVYGGRHSHAWGYFREHTGQRDLGWNWHCRLVAVQWCCSGI